VSAFPYAITIWRGDWIELARCARFETALLLHKALNDRTAQIINRDRQDTGNESGLTDEEKEQL
jgi:hypothetical protein